MKETKPATIVKVQLSKQDTTPTGPPLKLKKEDIKIDSAKEKTDPVTFLKNRKQI